MERERFTEIISKSVVSGAHIRSGVFLRYLSFCADVFEIAFLIRVGLVQRFGQSVYMTLTDSGSKIYSEFSVTEGLKNNSNDINSFAFFTSDKICYVNFPHGHACFLL